MAARPRSSVVKHPRGKKGHVVAFGMILLMATSWSAELGFTSTSAASRSSRSKMQRLAEAAAPSDCVDLQDSTVAVVGATGRTGKLVVQELLQNPRVGKVLAIARNSSKVADTFSNEDSRLSTLVWDFNSTLESSAVAGVGAMVWCAEGQTGLAPTTSFLAGLGKRSGGEPRFVMCSTASLTRPTWSKGKQERFKGAADIPIVRLNPGDILGTKRASEDKVRLSGTSYTIVRPTGLNDNWPAGRPVLSQGDFAVGRTSREDLATLLVQMLFEPDSVGKTFEAVSVAGYPKPANGYGPVLSRLQPDAKPGLPRLLKRLGSWLMPSRDGADAATYGVLQQLLPGEEQDSAALAMGQTYEQYDKGVVGRLGERGREKVPASVVG